MANTSEFVYFLKQDRDLLEISHDIQVRLVEPIRQSFFYLIKIFQDELDQYLTLFTTPGDNIEYDIYSTVNDENFSGENNLTKFELSDTRWLIPNRNSSEYHQLTLGDFLLTLSSIMDLLRKSRINATLTIQIFSQIFHYINSWLFNRIVCYPELKLCSRMLGEKLSFRLKFISDWAQKQGLELASEYHLTKVNQLCLLLQSSKYDDYDVQRLLSNTMFEINSIQVTQVLNNYVLTINEPPISSNFSQV